MLGLKVESDFKNYLRLQTNLNLRLAFFLNSIALGSDYCQSRGILVSAQYISVLDDASSDISADTSEGTTCATIFFLS